VTSVALAARQVFYEQRSFWRNPPAAVFTFVFPILFLFLFNLVFGARRVTLATGNEVPAAVFYVPAIAAFSVITACFTNVAMGIAIARDRGILKRMRGTPLPGWAYLAGRIGSATAIALLLVAIVAVVGKVVYDIPLPTNTLPGLVTTLVVGAASFAALGVAMTAAIRDADAAPAVVNAAILPLVFISDVLIPLEDPPRWIVAVGYVFPVRHLSEAMQTVFDPLQTGAGIEWGHLGVVAAWGVAGAAAALRFFAWEPRR
jgi:ABC-2 type transport system permease protein